jgi:hypothetical protein
MACVALGFLVAAAPAAAQQAPAGSLAAVGEVTGVIFDSLSAAPLRGALVWIENSLLSTVSDGRGRFHFDSVPAGPRLILFAHPELDSIGFPQFGRRVMVSAAVPSTATLAVPSLATIHRSLCGAALPTVRRGQQLPGIIFGAVSEASADTRLAGARVEVSWVEVDFQRQRRVEIHRRSVDVRSDGLGNFYACGVPSGQMVSLGAATTNSASGRLDVLIGPRRVTRQDLRIALDSTIALDSAGKLTGRAVVFGMVRAESGGPLRDVQALVDDAGSEAASDAAGRFVLTNLPAGSHMLMVRAIGYAALRVPVQLRAADTVRVAVTLHQLTVLDTITVAAPRSTLLAEMADRVRSGWGHTLVGDQVRRAAQMSAVLWQLPSIQVRDTGRRLWIVGHVGARECAATVWIDGFRADAEQLQLLRPRNIVAVEWYPRDSQVPMRYAPPSFDRCGVLLVWTDMVR